MKEISSPFEWINKWVHAITRVEGLPRHAFGSIMTRIGASVLAFLMSVVLARFLGTSEYGLFVYSMGWLNILLIPASLGFDKLLVRQVAVYQSRSEWEKLRGIYHFAISSTLIASIGMGLLMVGIIHVAFDSDYMSPIFFLVALLVPVGALIRMSQGILQGLRFVALGQLPEFIIQPLVLILLLFVVFQSTRQHLIASQAMILNVISGGLALCIGIWLLNRLSPVEIRGAKKIIDSEYWIPSLILLMVVGGVLVLNDQISIVLLGFLSDSHEIAVFSAAEKWSRFAIFMLVALNPALAPIFARLYAHNEMEDLQRVVVLSAQFITLFALIPLLAFMAVPQLFLSVFGGDFSAGRIPLILLGAGQFINACTGSVGVLLTMTGHESTVIWSSILGLVVNLLLGLILIPNLGAIGAAIATSASIILMNVILSFFVFRKLNIAPTVIGPLLVKFQKILR